MHAMGEKNLRMQRMSEVCEFGLVISMLIQPFAWSQKRQNMMKKA